MFRLGSSRPFRNRQVTSTPGIEISEADGVRALHIDSSTVQSAMRLSAPYDLELAYSRGIMTFLLFRREVREVLVLGLGGGSIPKFIHHYLPEMRTRVVEINPQVTAIARSHFMLPDDDVRLQVIEADAAQYLPAHPASADLLILDVFDGQGIPPALYSQAFFDSSADALKPEGMLAVNLWGSDRNFDIYLQRIEQSFAHRVLVMPTGRPGNIVVFAFRKPPADLRWNTLRERAKGMGQEFGIEFLEFVERLRDNNLSTANRLML